MAKHGRSRDTESSAQSSAESSAESSGRRRSGGRRTALYLLAGCTVLLVLAVASAAWLYVRGSSAADALTAAQDDLSATSAALRQGDVPAAEQSLAAAQGNTQRARDLTSDPVFAVAAAVPLLGQTPAAVSTVAETADDLADGALADLVDAGAALDPRTLRSAGNRIDLAAFERAGPPLEQALVGLADAQAQLADLELGFTPARVGRAVDDLTSQLDDTTATTEAALKAVRLLPPMLGADGPRRYFLAIQSNNEARGTGGFLGAYGIIRADDGKVTVEKVAPRSDLDPLVYDKPPLDFGPDYAALYGDEPGTWASANLSPHYPYAAQLWLQMYADRTGDQLDGVITLDPVTMKYLLAVTGPAAMADGRVISADNVVPFTENEVYSVIRNDGKRDLYLQEVGKTVLRRMLSGEGDPQALLDALGHAADDRRLLVYSAVPDEQALLETTSVGGVVPEGPGPFAGLAVINGSGNKLDYYLAQELDYETVRCNADGSSLTRITVTLRNEAPKRGTLPLYVDQRLDLPLGPGGVGVSRGGDHFVYAQVYAAQDAALVKAELDGRPVAVAPGVERGRPVFRVPVAIPAGRAARLTFDVLEPPRPEGVDPTARTFVSPLVKPIVVRADDPGC